MKLILVWFMEMEMIFILSAAHYFTNCHAIISNKFYCAMIVLTIANDHSNLQHSLAILTNQWSRNVFWNWGGPKVTATD